MPEAAPAPTAETPSFFEKLFAASRTRPGPGLRRPGEPRLDRSRGRSVPHPGRGRGGTAIYDISARTVTLPNGEVLEAHSGLGASSTTRGYVHAADARLTPPGTYDLTEREALFHGVRAIRLNPVGGSGAIYGRVGLLAHTFMLGPERRLERLRIVPELPPLPAGVPARRGQAPRRGRRPRGRPRPLAASR